MTNPLSLNTILTPSAGNTGAPKDPKKIAEAATQFESMLIEQMMRSSRESGSGDWSGCGDDQTSSTTCELAEQQFAQLIAAKGGFGVAKLVMTGLEKKK